MLPKEVETMRLIVMNTDIPVTWPVDFSGTLNNKFGFPYIVMKESPGKAATKLWFEQYGNIPTHGTEVKRLNFLRSLAQNMTELHKLQFNQIGMPRLTQEGDKYYKFFEEVEGKRLPVNKYYVWPYSDSYDHLERGPFASTQAYINDVWEDINAPTEGPDRDPTWDELMRLGTIKILDIVLRHPVFNSKPKDTFVLRHSDLDTQNILIDDAGNINITGIINWDTSLAMPHCVSHASVPHFLDRDWHKDAFKSAPFLFWRSGYYRSLYSAAMVEADNPDSKYTSKSHIYQAVFAALHEDSDPVGLVDRLISAIPGQQLSTEDTKMLVAKDCTPIIDMLKKELWKILDPEMRPENLLHQVEQQHMNGARIQAWMDEFVECTPCSSASRVSYKKT